VGWCTTINSFARSLPCWGILVVIFHGGLDHSGLLLRRLYRLCCTLATGALPTCASSQNTIRDSPNWNVRPASSKRTCAPSTMTRMIWRSWKPGRERSRGTCGRWRKRVNPRRTGASPARRGSGGGRWSLLRRITGGRSGRVLTSLFLGLLHSTAKMKDEPVALLRERW